MVKNRHVPYGYVMICGNIHIHREYSKIVIRIFQDYIEGVSQKQISKNLTNEGIFTSTGKVVWSHAAVRAILTNVKYMGDQYHPVLIPAEDFRKAMSIRVTRNNEIRKCMTKKKISNCYSGKIFCASCGGLYTKKSIFPKGKNGVPKVNWICKNYISENKRKCSNLIIEEKQIDNSFNKIISSIKKNPALIYVSDHCEVRTNFEINKLTVFINNEIEHHRKCKLDFQEMLLIRAKYQYDLSDNHNKEIFSNKIIAEIMSINTRTFNESLFETIVKSIKIEGSGYLHYTFMNGATIKIRIGVD